MDFGQPGQATDQLRRARIRGVDDVENAPSGFVRRRQSNFARLGKDRADRKPKRLYFFRRNAGLEKDRRALLVREEKIVGTAPIPNRVHADRIRNDDDALVLRRAFPAQQLIEHVGIGRVDRDNDVRLKTREHSAQVIFQREEDAKIADEILLPVEPPVDDAPDPRSAIDHPHVEDPRPVVAETVGLGEKIVQLDVRAFGRNLAQAIADAAGGAVVALAEPGGQDQDFFQNSLGQQARAKVAGEFNGYLVAAK